MASAKVSELHRWATLELAPWQGVAFEAGELEQRQSAACTANPHIRIFRVEEGAVTVEAIPSERIPGSAETELVEGRARAYGAFLEEVVAAHRIDGRFAMAMTLADGGADYRDLPIFAFQKVRGNAAILLPDIDFLLQDFFRGEAVRDPIPFDDKLAEAVFVGSTSGAWITKEMVQTGNHPRLRSALAFRDEPRVTFELPVIVQCDSPEVHAAVEALGVKGRLRDWQEQFAYRYLLSMDGNGATCSRVAIALRSQAVLVKYGSAHQLFYFHGLEPWAHYLPVRKDADVLRIVNEAARTEGRDRRIAEAGQDFAAAYLGYDAVLAYTADLLRGYRDIVAA